MRHALAVCLFFGLWGEFGRPYGSPGCISSNPKLRRSLVVLLGCVAGLFVAQHLLGSAT